MQQVKIFIGVEDHRAELEAEVNAWLKDSGAKIHSVTGNIAPQTLAKEATTLTGTGRSFRPSDVFILVVYEI